MCFKYQVKKRALSLLSLQNAVSNLGNMYTSILSVGILLVTWVLQEMEAELSLSFETPVTLFSTAVANLLLCGWILLTTGNFTDSVKGKSSILRCNRCYGLRHLMMALGIKVWQEYATLTRVAIKIITTNLNVDWLQINCHYLRI